MVIQPYTAREAHSQAQIGAEEPLGFHCDNCGMEKEFLPTDDFISYAIQQETYSEPERICCSLACCLKLDAQEGLGARFPKPVPLLAVRSDGNHTVREFELVASFEEATVLADKMEADETWPEGYDAVVRPGDNTQFVYSDRWEDYS